jgi:GNAT acetyltransferase-like protein/PilZ domain-containing protein
MRGARQNPSPALGVPERRSCPRRRVQSAAHVKVGASRGLVSNISEGGLSVIAAAPEIEQQISLVVFPLPVSGEQVEIKGQIAWLSESGREAGIRFIDLPERTRASIHEWISSESSPGTFQQHGRVSRPQIQASYQSYNIRELHFDAELNRSLKSWAEWQRQIQDHTLYGDLEWIAQRFQHEKENIRLFLLEKGNEIVGVVPFVLNREQPVCELGQYALATIPMRTLCLQGYTLNIPREEAAYDRLFEEILHSDVDALYIENANIRSFLWDYLRSSSLVRQEFHFYTTKGPLPHCLIRLDGTFESYMKRFSSKTRKNRLRELKTLGELGPVTLMRVSRQSEIDAFLESAYYIAQRTWQFKRFGRGLASRDQGVVRNELRFLAEHGWLRSYVLKCNAVSCSFILGHQYGSSFHAETVGVDDAWRTYSVGTIVLLLVLENLFKDNPPEFYDFGTPIKFHENFATESYPEARVWLFRRRAYPILASSVYRACNAVSINAGTLLNRFGLKLKLKKMLWKRG